MEFAVRGAEAFGGSDVYDGVDWSAVDDAAEENQGDWSGSEWEDTRFVVPDDLTLDQLRRRVIEVGEKTAVLLRPQTSTRPIRFPKRPGSSRVRLGRCAGWRSTCWPRSPSMRGTRTFSGRRSTERSPWAEPRAVPRVLGHGEGQAYAGGRMGNARRCVERKPMTARKLDGKATAAAIKQELATRVAELRERGIVPGLGTVLVGDDPGSQIYVNGKHRDCHEVGIASIRVDLPAETATEQLRAEIDALNANDACTGYIVQLPLPKHLDEHAALALIDPDKDADGLAPMSLGKLVLGEPGPLPCTPRGIVELLRRHEVELNGAEVCVVGRGTTVGRPLGLLLTRRSENATVTLCHTGTRDLAAHTRAADIVVGAAGVPGLITADMIKPGAALVDVGITRNAEGKQVGDFAPEVWDVAGWVTPNPGGVGPMTRAMLLKNVVERAEALAAGG